MSSVAVVITLEYSGEHVHLRVINDHADESPKDMHLMLDPKTLLIAEDP